jgi:hypothetical protein
LTALLAGNLASAWSLTVLGDRLYFIGSGGSVHSLRLPNGIGNAASEQFAQSSKVKSVVADRDGVYWVQNDSTADGTRFDEIRVDSYPMQ